MSTYYINNLGQTQQDRYEKHDITVITPKEIASLDLKSSDELIVLCELDIDADGNNIKRTKFYGVKLVQDLRRKKFMGKVLFVSFVKEDYFVEKKLKTILTSIGHSFLRLPAQPDDWKEELKNVLVLNDLSHHDIIHHFIGEKAVINERIHSLESRLSSKESLSDEDKKTCIKIIESTFNTLKINSDTVIKDFKKSVKTGKEAIEFVKTKCMALLPDDENAVQDKLKPEWKYWKVLWLDDKESDESPLKSELEDKRNVTVEIVKTYDEAIKAWTKDYATTQEICLVIADFRLEDAEEKSRKKQGYQFLKDIADKGLGVGLIAYSALTRRFLFETFKLFGVHVNIFSKIDFNQANQNNVDYLADQIVQLGDEHWIMRNNQPQSTVWRNEISQHYFNFKQSTAYYAFEKALCLKATENLKIFIGDFNKCSTQKQLWSLKFTDNIVVKTSKFPQTKKKASEAIRELLTTRRLAIGLYAFLWSDKNKKNDLICNENYSDYVRYILINSDDEKTVSVLWNENFEIFIKGDLRDKINNKGEKVKKKNGDIKQERKGGIRSDSNYKNTLPNQALTFDTSWPFGLLPEEYAWLQFDSGLDINYIEINKSYWRKILSIRIAVKNAFDESKFLRKLLYKNNLTLPDLEEPNEAKTSDDKILYFNEDNVPLIRLVITAKKLLKLIYDKLDPSSDNYGDHLKVFYYLVKRILEISTTTSFTNNETDHKTQTRKIKKIPSLKYFIDHNFLAKTENDLLEKSEKRESLLDEYIRLYKPWRLWYPHQFKFEDDCEYEKECQNRKKQLISACNNEIIDGSNSGRKLHTQLFKDIYDWYHSEDNKIQDKILKRNNSIYVGLYSYKQRINDLHNNISTNNNLVDSSISITGFNTTKNDKDYFKFNFKKIPKNSHDKLKILVEDKLSELNIKPIEETCIIICDINDDEISCLLEIEDDDSSFSHIFILNLDSKFVGIDYDTLKYYQDNLEDFDEVFDEDKRSKIQRENISINQELFIFGIQNE